MTSVSKELYELQETVQELHEIRLQIISSGELIERLNNQVNQMLLQDPIYQEILAAKEQLKLTKQLEADKKAELKDQGEIYWDGLEDKSDKQIPGGSISITNDHSYNEDEVLIWAENNFAAAIIRTVSVDKVALKSVAFAQYQAGEIKIPSYKITEIPVFKIASDLSKHVQDLEDDHDQ